MTATEELRRLLDERGVEWWPSAECWCEDAITYWRVGVMKWAAIEGEKDLWLNAGIAGYEPLTPEQAIAATLGRGTCRLKRAQWDDGTCTWGCICTACDAHLEHETGIGYNYCPHCGRKVVDE